MRLSFLYFILFVSVVPFLSCDTNKNKVDLSSISINLKFNRFELDLFELSQDGFTQEELSILSNKYPKLYQLYVEAIMRFGPKGSDQVLEVLNKYTADEDIKELFKVVEKKYPRESLQQEMKELGDGFKYFKHFFPQRTVPEVKSMISAFTYNTVADDSLLVIGLDTYLGGDFVVYPQTGIPKYKFEKFSRDYMVSDALKAWIVTEFEENGGKNLLEQMIFQGKILFLLNTFLPEKEKHIIFNYSTEELKWCEQNEAQIWFHFVDMDLLYSIENHQIKKYLGDAPFISGFPEGSPGRVGQWVGFQIVDSFMENHSKIGIKQLMEIKDANRILQQSNYKPRR